MTQTIETSAVPYDQLEALERFSLSDIGSELRDVLMSVSRCIENGDDLVVVKDRQTFSPAHVAKRLGMSRTHLYKLLDSGEILSHRVGRDRRIALKDIIAFETQRQADRRQLAERFAQRGQIHDQAIDEIADLL